MKQMKKMSVILIIIFSPWIGYSQAGELDETFGTNGIVTYDWGGGHDNTQDIHIYDDNTMLVCGDKGAPGFVFSAILQKFLPNGDVDTSWGTDGIVEFQHGEDTHAYTLKILDDGSIVVSGATYVTVPDAEFFVSKFNSDGTPDLSFNGTGTWIGSYTPEEELADDMAIQPDGKIVLAGRTFAGTASKFLFARINTDGTLDMSFGTNGYTEIDSSPQHERINALGFLNSGEIIGAGTGYVGNPWFTDFAKIVRLDANGIPDGTFGPNGVIIPDLFTNDPSEIWDCIVEDNSIYIVGRVDISTEFHLVVAKFDMDGNTDTSFGTNGLTTFYLNDVTAGLDIEHYEGDDKFYVAGTTGLAGPNDREFLLLRYNPDGTIDNTFNGTGYVTTNIRPDWDEANAMDFQPDGKIVLAGFSSGFSTSGDNDRNLVRYLNDVVLATNDFNSDGLNIYPNPINEILNISAKETIGSISINNVLGQKLYSSNVDALDVSIDLSSYAAGTYFVMVRIGDETITKKIIKK